MAHICCSPPESVPASCFCRSRSLGKRVKTHSSVSLRWGLASGAKRAELEVFQHAHFREKLPSFRYVGNAVIDNPVGWRLIDALVFEPDGATRRVDDAGDGPHDGTFAGAVGSDQDDEFLDRTWKETSQRT